MGPRVRGDDNHLEGAARPSCSPTEGTACHPLGNNTVPRVL